ncbi:DUF6789 family protein [Aquipuribacter sp. MA13-6]|uniref:DUF6789 family protein n=1 Tax=unclassified Aquipuribacter TaxID=2635084 RepID=UPI003EF06EB5
MVQPKRALVDVLTGAAVGAAATLPMSALMLGAQRAGLMGTQPPRRVTDEAIEVVDDATDEPVDPPETARRALTALNHLGFGAVAGAPFALLHRALPDRVPSEVAGAAYGLGVWASAYLGWVPALGIMPSAEDDRPDRPASMIAAHLVYGAVLGAGVRHLRPRD